MPALLEVEQLCVEYGSSRALTDVDLTVREGSVVGVLGANGAGKSTLMRTIAGLVAPTSGTISFHGERVDTRPAHTLARRGICLIPEGRGILPNLTVADNMRVASSRDSDVVARAYERFPQLAARSTNTAGTLSGGEQQMLAFTRAFGDSVELLLVDEPSLGLAPRLVGIVASTLRDLHAMGRTIVWVEQYASRVLALSDVVYILGRGRVVWFGDPAELRSSQVLVKSYLGGTALD
jgi:branched-chain amino acid transport system ATP-binding protein